MRDLVAVIFLGVCLLKGTLDNLTDMRALDWFRETSDRMRSLRTTADALRSLGASGVEIGYLTVDDPASRSEFYFGLQYQVLPSMLVESAAPALVIVHASDPARLATLQRTNHLVLVGSAGNGFYLLKHEAL